MAKREGYSKRMERKLEAWKLRFLALRAEAEKAGDKLPADTREKLEASKVAGDAAFAKLSELMVAADKWRKIRAEMEAAWHVMAEPRGEAGAAPRLRVTSE